jgi:hypothetical protein
MQKHGCYSTSVYWDNSANLAKLVLSAHGLAELDIPFTVKEAWRTIEQLPSDIAPGPYVLMGFFYKSSWPIYHKG